VLRWLERAAPAVTGLVAVLGACAAAGPRPDPAVLERCRKLTLLRLACIHREAKLLAAAERDRFAPAAARRAGAGANA
jgi:hypothetical protein